MTRTLVVHCHPIPDSFTAAVRDRVITGLDRSGHEVRCIEINGPPTSEAPGHEESLVLVYPTWWSGQPAALQHWLAEHRDAFGAIRHLTAVTTHGSPWRINLLEGQTGRRVLKRQVLPRCATGARFDWLACYRIDDCPERDRVRFLDQVERHFSRHALNAIPRPA